MAATTAATTAAIGGGQLIVVMQCAKTKQSDAGVMRTAEGCPVRFVAQPELAPTPDRPTSDRPTADDPAPLFARPDDIADTDSGQTWRDKLFAYNLRNNTDIQDIRHLIEGEPTGRKPTPDNPSPDNPSSDNPSSDNPSSDNPSSNNPSPHNPLNLFPAAQLYRNKTYRLLLSTFGPSNFYVFSAGWGLVRSDFWIPNYDITLSPGASGPDRYKRRLSSESYADFNMLASDVAGPVLYLGSKVYVPLFCQLTGSISAERIVYYNSKHPPDAPRCELRKYDIPKKTDWHYDCAKALAATPEKFV